MILQDIRSALAYNVSDYTIKPHGLVYGDHSDGAKIELVVQNLREKGFTVKSYDYSPDEFIIWIDYRTEAIVNDWLMMELDDYWFAIHYDADKCEIYAQRKWSHHQWYHWNVDLKFLRETVLKAIENNVVLFTLTDYSYPYQTEPHVHFGQEELQRLADYLVI